MLPSPSITFVTQSSTLFCYLVQFPVLRKYSSVLDLPMSFLLAPNVYTAGLRDWMITVSCVALDARSQDTVKNN